MKFSVRLPSKVQITQLGVTLVVTPQSSSDIRLFLSSKFSEIVERKHFLPGNWPGETDLETCAIQCGGLLIYARTMIQFVNQGKPVKRLQLALSGKGGRDGLYNLYALILKTSFPGESIDDSEELTDFKKAAGAISLSKSPFDVDTIMALHKWHQQTSVIYAKDYQLCSNQEICCD